jgi:hypothetical protein
LKRYFKILSALHREDDVDVDLRIGVCHVSPRAG